MDGGSRNCIGDRDQDHPKKKKCKKAKWLSEETFQIAVKRHKTQREKGKIYPLVCRVPKNSKER